MPQTTALASATRELGNIRHALDQSAIVAITDGAGLITHVNDNFCTISCYSREELLGKNHRILNSGHHSPEFFSKMWKRISTGQTWEGEIRNQTRDGTHYWVNTTIVPFLDDRGVPYQYVSIRYEITQRKRAEEQIRIYAERLERSNQDLQDFASIAAHDLQEPLRKIQTFGDRIRTKCRDQLNDEGRDYLDRMLGSAKRMRKHIDDLLVYSRVTTTTRAFGETNLDEVFSGVLQDLEVQIEQTHGRVESGILGLIDADASQMRQLLQNLIANALKFHKLGEIPTVRVAARTEGHFRLIEVIDDGIGFDEKYSEKIFTLFQRLHGRSEYEGTGVGLAVCRRIVERHHGSIQVRSRPGQGTTFTVSLPTRHAVDV